MNVLPGGEKGKYQRMELYWHLICYDAYSNPNLFATIAILFFSIFLQRWGHLKSVGEYAAQWTGKYLLIVLMRPIIIIIDAY